MHTTLTGFQRSRHATHEHRFARVQRHRGVQHVVGIGQTPRPNLHRLVLDGRRRHAQVQLVLVGDARLNQLLHAALVLFRANGTDSDVVIHRQCAPAAGAGCAVSGNKLAGMFGRVRSHAKFQTAQCAVRYSCPVN